MDSTLQELFSEKVTRYIKSFYPLISLSTFQEAYTDELIQKWAKKMQKKSGNGAMA